MPPEPANLRDRSPRRFHAYYGVSEMYVWIKPMTGRRFLLGVLHTDTIEVVKSKIEAGIAENAPLSQTLRNDMIFHSIYHLGVDVFEML